MRVLVIETAFVGDVIISLALARALKHRVPAAHISYLVRPEAADIVRICPDVDDVIVFDKYDRERGTAGVARKALELNALAFDVMILLHGSRRSQTLASQLTAT